LELVRAQRSGRPHRSHRGHPTVRGQRRWQCCSSTSTSNPCMLLIGKAATSEKMEENDSTGRFGSKEHRWQGLPCKIPLFTASASVCVLVMQWYAAGKAHDDAVGAAPCCLFSDPRTPRAQTKTDLDVNPARCARVGDKSSL